MLPAIAKLNSRGIPSHSFPTLFAKSFVFLGCHVPPKIKNKFKRVPFSTFISGIETEMKFENGIFPGSIPEGKQQ